MPSGLTSQQKDLVIIHLKSEVYELKQSENDYRQLAQQVAQLEERLRFLAEEKAITLRDYEGKIAAQEKQIQIGQRERDELRRINGGKELDNDGLRERALSNKDLLRSGEAEYLQLREQNEEQIRRNKALKDDVAALEDRLSEERARQLDLRGAKDKAGHQLFRATDDAGQLRVKEEELLRRLREKEFELRAKEERLAALEQDEKAREGALTQQRSTRADEEQRLSLIMGALSQCQQENEALLERNRRLRAQCEVEDVRAKEQQVRLREVEDKLARRDHEHSTVYEELSRADDDVRQLKQRYEALVLERNALKVHADNLMQANLEIEKELDSFVNLDDSIVKTLEKRDDRLSPVRPLSFQPGLGGAASYSLAHSRMFDIRSAEQAKLA